MTHSESTFWRKAGTIHAAVLALCFGIFSLLTLTGCQSMNGAAAWKSTFKHDLPLYGDRNWIAVVDSAYPDQTKPGVETVVTHRNMFPVLKFVLAQIAKAPHVRAEAYTDKELHFVTDAQTPGISAYRTRLNAMLAGIPHFERMHIHSIHRLNKDGKIFNILILKTNLVMPYTSVFIHLKCGYWTDADEAALRKAMGTGH